MSRVYEAWRRTDAGTAEAPRAIEKAEATATVPENAAAGPGAQRSAHMAPTSLFPLRESLEGAESPVLDATSTRPLSAEAGPRTRNVPFEELIRDIARDEQRMNL